MSFKNLIHNKYFNNESDNDNVNDNYNDRSYKKFERNKNAMLIRIQYSSSFKET